MSESEQVQSLAFVWLMVAVCSVAVFSNLLVIIVIVLDKTLNSVTEMFLVNLAFSDLILAGIGVPLKLAQAASHSEDFEEGNIGCKLIMFLPLLSITCSISTMVAISLDRYLVIVHQYNLARVKVRFIIVAVWVLALAVSAPQLYEYSVVDKPDVDNNQTTHLSCGSHGIDEGFELVYAVVIVSVSYFLPLAVIVVNYMNIGRFLWRVSRQVSGGNTSNVSKSKVAVVKMLALAATLFAVLWAPFFVLFTMEEIAGTDDSDSGGSTLDLVKQSMIILSTVTNPTVYALFNKRIRKGVVNMFRRCASSNSDITTTTTHNNPVVLDTN